MYIAVVATKRLPSRHTDQVVEIATNEKASLIAMQAYTSQGYRCVRFVTTEQAYIDDCHGKEFTVEFESDGTRNLKRYLKTIN